MRWSDVDDCLDLLWVGLDAASGDEVCKYLASGYSEEAFLRVQLDLISLEVVEGFSQIVDVRGAFAGFDDNIIDVDFNVFADLLAEASLYAPLVGGSSVFQAK